MKKWIAWFNKNDEGHSGFISFKADSVYISKDGEILNIDGREIEIDEYWQEVYAEGEE